VPLRARLYSLDGDLRLAFLQASLVTTLLAHQTWLMGDAIVRTLWRLLVSRRLLLQWVPAAQAAAARLAPAISRAKRFEAWTAGWRVFAWRMGSDPR
jgi:cyclic beta-1,2-glucan synthetase